MIEAKIYDQDGNLVSFKMKDSKFNEQFKEWLAIHDRYNGVRE